MLISVLVICVCTFCVQQEQHQDGSEPLATIDSEAETQGFTSVPKCATRVPQRMRILEAFALILDIVISLILQIRTDHDKYLGTLLLSVFLVALVAARDHNSRLYPSLRSHSEALYYVQWACIVIIAQTKLDAQQSKLTQIAFLLRVVLFTGLILIHWMAPRVAYGNIYTSTLGRDERASLYSRFQFSWLNELLWKAFRAGPLERSDLYPLNKRLTSILVTPAFRTQTTYSLSMLGRIFQFMRADLLKQGVRAAVTSVAVFVPPLLIKRILEYLDSSSDIPIRTAWYYVFGLLISSLIAGVADCQCGWVGFQISTKVRTIILDQIYAKVLRRRMTRPSLSSDAQAGENGRQTSDGAIFNFVAGDVDFISFMSGSLYLVWVTFPVQITVGTWLLYQIMGVSGILGVATMIALLPLHVLLSRRMAAVQGQVLAASDARIHASNEVLNVIRTIKFYAWEAHFKDRILQKRLAEMKVMRTRFVWWSITMTVFHSLPFIVTIITCFFYTVVFRQSLVTSIAFPALATFSVLRIPLDRMADSIKFLIQAHVSFVRIDSFLREPETEKRAQLSKSQSGFVGFHRATLTWPMSNLVSSIAASEDMQPLNSEPPSSDFRLENLDINFRQEALNVVCGPSGSGKSSLLLALLGEMQLESGRVSLPYDPRPFNFAQPGGNLEFELGDTAAYCPHEPWILNQSIRANVLLGMPFNSLRYQEVLRAVALDTDIAIFNDGDQTLAGENGSRLSGGQKQRVSLARALYHPSRHVLLDDCLSALDSRTARHVFFNAITGPLMRGRTCVLATHHIQLCVPRSAYVVKLEAGRVSAQGPTHVMVSQGLVDAQMIHNDSVTREDAGPSDAAERLTPPRGGLQDEQETMATSRPDEDRAEGAVPWSVVRNYLQAMGSIVFWILIVVGFAAQQLAALGTNLWIREWASQYDQVDKEFAEKPTVATIGKVPASYYLMIYTGLCLTYALVTFLRDLVTFSGSLRASTRFYKRLLDSVLFAKLAFFDRPLGQITNRFSKDISVVDQSIASFSVSALQLAATVAMIVILMLSLLPGGFWLLIVLGIVFVAYYITTAVYIRGSQDLKRIEAISRSPLYQQVGETIAGYVSIRGLGLESEFAREHGDLVDGLNQPYLLLSASEQWLKMRVNILSSMITFATGAWVVWGRESIDPGAAGLILTYAATFTENMLWLVQVYAIIQQNLTSVERIAEYMWIEQEPTGLALGRLPQRVSEDWPMQGGVVFRNFTARYAPHLEPVLRNISFQAEAGERVAIVGRTGAGKSSMALALLQVLQADVIDGGSIEIDGVDIAGVELSRLRGKAITMIPQDPQLFDGTVRTNLDPLGQHSDPKILDVLRSMRPQLQDQDAFDLSLNLEQPASRLSRGQCQLLCVARGLLRNSRVLVLDEATANVDHVADAAIQAGLRARVSEAGTTVITIAHRLLTIADYDRVVVLDEGCLVEQGTIKELLGRGRDESIFRRLCEESGDFRAIQSAAGL